MSRDRKTLVCDDHPLFRSGVVQCLNQISGIDVVAEAADVASAIAKLQLYEPDILVTDLSMPGQSGFDLSEWTVANIPEVHTIVLSMHSELAFVKRAKSLGAFAFVAKEDAETELVHAVAATRDRFYTSDSIGRSNELPDFQSKAEDLEAIFRNVSAAEMKVLVEVSHSKTSREIAQTLHISHRTVESHRQSLAQKLEIEGPNKLLEFAIKHRNYLTDGLNSARQAH